MQVTESVSQVMNAVRDTLESKLEHQGETEPALWKEHSMMTLLADIEAEVIRLKAACHDWSVNVSRHTVHHGLHADRVSNHAMNAALALIKLAYTRGNL
jgi:hypothetical protein